MIPGNRVRIERDETLYPSKGTWPRFRGKTGTVVGINYDEYGVSFSKPRRRLDGSLHGDDVATWFKTHELTALAPVRHADGPLPIPRIDNTREVLAHV